VVLREERYLGEATRTGATGTKCPATDGNSNSIGDDEFSPKDKRSGYCQTG